MFNSLECKNRQNIAKINLKISKKSPIAIFQSQMVFRNLQFGVKSPNLATLVVARLGKILLVCRIFLFLFFCAWYCQISRRDCPLWCQRCRFVSLFSSFLRRWGVGSRCLSVTFSSLSFSFYMILCILVSALLLQLAAVYSRLSFCNSIGKIIVLLVTGGDNLMCLHECLVLIEAWSDEFEALCTR